MSAYLPSVLPLLGAVFFGIAGAQCWRGGKHEGGKRLLATGGLLVMAAAGLLLL